MHHGTHSAPALLAALGLMLAACQGGGDGTQGTFAGGETGGDETEETTGSTEASTGDSTGESTGDSGPAPKLDVGGGDDSGDSGDPCHDGGEPLDFAFIWIANSAQGTVSKIDTETNVEVARYRTGAGDGLEPSRTSVNLVGDAVVVNRGTNGAGSITKIAAVEERCVDLDDSGQIDTSQGPNDVLPWGEDECVLWNQTLESLGHIQGPRPVAWEGALDNEGCAAFDPRVWVAFYDAASNEGVFRRLAGATGDELDEVTVPWSGEQYGPYGGAINGEGDFVALGWQLGPLVRIDGDSLEVQSWDLPPELPSAKRWSYGMALDPDGNAWVTSMKTVLHFDMDTEQWTEITTGNYSTRGVAVDSEFRVWIAVDAGPNGERGLSLVDGQSKTVIKDIIPVPGSDVPVGVSVDPDGFIWLVDMKANAAFKVDPDTYQLVGTTSGLVQPYTYSDMTGGGLKGVVFPPAG